MLVREQVKVVKKYIKYLEGNKQKWVAAGRVSEGEVNYDIECLKYAINSLIELEQFQLKIISLNERNLKNDKE